MLSFSVSGGTQGLGLGIARAHKTVGYNAITIIRHERKQLASAIVEPVGGGRGEHTSSKGRPLAIGI